MNPLSPDLRNRWKAKLLELFGIDLRSLALFRIATGLVMLYDLAIRSSDVRSLYSDKGIMPLADLFELYKFEEISWHWSLYFLNGSVEYQWFLFAITAICAISLVVGFQTRLTTIACWILIVSLHQRAPLILNGGDVLLGMMLFWGMFLPLGKRFSIDAVGKPVAEPSNQKVLSIASAAAMLQICFMYFFTGIYKSNDVWFSGEAIQNALSFAHFVRPVGSFLTHFPGLLWFLTHATIWLELLCPILFFFPWRNTYFRSVTLVSFLLLHIGIELSLGVLLFSFMSMAALMVFIPTHFWNNSLLIRLAAKAKIWLPVSQKRASELVNVHPIWNIFLVTKGWKFVQNLICLTMLLYSFVFALGTVIDQDRFYREMPVAMRAITQFAAAGQQWSMFAAPDGIDHWVVARAKLSDGTEVNLLRRDAQLDLSLPSDFSKAYPSQHWDVICGMLLNELGEVYIPAISNYLCRQWNQHHDPEQQVREFDLLYLSEAPLEDAEPYKLLHHLKHGHWILHHKDGSKASEGNFDYGLEQGPWTHWSPEGHKLGRGEYNQGELHGKWKFWYEDGSLSEVVYKDGKLVH